MSISLENHAKKYKEDPKKEGRWPYNRLLMAEREFLLAKLFESLEWVKEKERRGYYTSKGWGYENNKLQVGPVIVTFIKTLMRYGIHCPHPKVWQIPKGSPRTKESDLECVGCLSWIKLSEKARG